LIKRKPLSACIDSTGFETSHASLYYTRRKGAAKSHYSKLTAVCDKKTHLYFCAIADRGPLPDHVEFKEAITSAHKTAPIKELLADAGYDSEANHVLCREMLGIESIIPPRSGRRPKNPKYTPPTKYRKRMKQHFPTKRYGQRWQIESAISQTKRRFGSAVEGRGWQSILASVLMRVLAHNIALVLLSLRPTTLLFNRADRVHLIGTSILGVLGGRV
jgi:hypothetical protein